jgi:hypothetical protein
VTSSVSTNGPQAHDLRLCDDLHRRHRRSAQVRAVQYRSAPMAATCRSQFAPTHGQQTRPTSGRSVRVTLLVRSTGADPRRPVDVTVRRWRAASARQESPGRPFALFTAGGSPGCTRHRVPSPIRATAENSGHGDACRRTCAAPVSGRQGRRAAPAQPRRPCGCFAAALARYRGHERIPLVSGESDYQPVRGRNAFCSRAGGLPLRPERSSGGYPRAMPAFARVGRFAVSPTAPLAVTHGGRPKVPPPRGGHPVHVEGRRWPTFAARSTVWAAQHGGPR